MWRYTTPSAQAIDLTGHCLTDDEADPGKWVFPQGAAIPAGGYLLVYASGGAAGAAGELHASFKLDSAGETLLLTDPEGRAISRLSLPALKSDQAYSLGEDGTYTAALAPTPGLPNDSDEPRLQMARANAGGVYISELMASSDEHPHDWLEVYNASSQAADISGWGLSDDAASPPQVSLPAGHGHRPRRPSHPLPFRRGGYDGRRAVRLLPPFPPTAAMA